MEYLALLPPGESAPPVEKTPLQVFQETLQQVSTEKARYLVHYSMYGSHRRAMQYSQISESSSRRWRKDPEFLRLRELARQLNPGEVVQLLFSNALPSVIEQVIEIAVRPWEKLRHGEDRSKRWAMDMILSYMGIVRDGARVVVNQKFDFKAIVDALREKPQYVVETKGQVVEGKLVGAIVNR